MGCFKITYRPCNDAFSTFGKNLKVVKGKKSVLKKNRTNYFTFGMTMPGRQLTPASGSYRYGFNGKELDNNGTGMGGGGATYDYGFRIYNPQIAKFLSVDPLAVEYPWFSPYHFAGNSPIKYLDRDGLEPETYTMHLDNGDELVFELVAAQTVHEVVETSTEPNGDVNVTSKQGYIAVYQHVYTTDAENLISNTRKQVNTSTIVVTVVDDVKEVNEHMEDDVYKPPVEVSRTNAVNTTKALGITSHIEDPYNELIKDAAIVAGVTYLGERLIVAAVAEMTAFGSKSINDVVINSKGIENIRKHLSRMDADVANEMMVTRLEKIANGELAATTTDLNFYAHELREMSLMDKGLKYQEAHAQALKEYGVTSADLYTSEAVKAGDAAFEAEVNQMLKKGD